MRYLGGKNGYFIGTNTERKEKQLNQRRNTNMKVLRTKIEVLFAF